MMINIGNFNEQKVTLKFILIQITTERERCNTLPMEKECARLCPCKKKDRLISTYTNTSILLLSFIQPWEIAVLGNNKLEFA